MLAFRIFTLCAICAMFLGILSPGCAQSFALSIDPYDVVYGPKTERLYVSVYQESGTTDGIVAIVNPWNGTVERTIAVGPAPRHIALTEDESYLWVEGADFHIRRVNANQRGTPIEFVPSYPAYGCGTLMWITDIKGVPGHPESVAISFSCVGLPGQGDGHKGIAIYDKGVRRDWVAPNQESQGVLRFVFGNGDNRIWGYNQYSDSFELREMIYNSGGVGGVASYVGLTFGFASRIVQEGGVLFTTNGRAVNLKNHTLDGRFSGDFVVFASDFAIDAPHRLAYFVGGSPSQIQVFNIDTYSLISFYNIPYSPPAVPTHDRSDNYKMFAGAWGVAWWETWSNRISFYKPDLFSPVFSYSKPIVPAKLDTAVRTVAIPNTSIVYSARLQSLLIATPNWAGNAGNSLISLNPFTGVVGNPISLGSDPWQMTLSDQEKNLYISLYNGFGVVRLNLDTWKLDERIWLTSSGFYGLPTPTRAIELLPVPGHPESVIVAQGSHPGARLGQGSSGVTVFDNTVRRPLSTANATVGPYPMGADSIQLSADGNTVYAINSTDSAYSNWSGSWPLTTDGINYTGIKNYSDIFALTLRCQSDRCFSENGLIFDPIAQESRGYFPIVSNPASFTVRSVIPDLNRNRVYFASDSSTAAEVSAYDSINKIRVGAIRIAGISGPVTSAVLWGEDQIAIGDGVYVYLIPLKLVDPNLPDPSRSFKSNRLPANTGRGAVTRGIER